MLALRRRSAVLAAVLALALVAGPAASAACAHADAADRTAEHGAPQTDDALHGPHAPDAGPPCHPPPATPPPAADPGCVTLCCASEAPLTPDPPVPPTPDAPVPADVVHESSVPAPPVDEVVPDASPPPRASRLYVAYGQLLI